MGQALRTRPPGVFEYARRLRRHQGRLGDIWHVDEVFVKIGGERHYLWRAAQPRVDQDGDVIDVLVQRDRNARAAERFFRKLLKGQGSKPWLLVTDKLRSYGARLLGAHRRIMPSVDHNTERYANNLAEVSHQPTRQREGQMRGFKSAGKRQAQRFLSVHGVIGNLFNFGRHQLSSANYRLLRERSFKEWTSACGMECYGCLSNFDLPPPESRSGRNKLTVPFT